MVTKKIVKKKNPKDLTDYSLRGLRNDISELQKSVAEIEKELQVIETILGL